MARPKINPKISKNVSKISTETNQIPTKNKSLFDHINHIREVKSHDYYDNLMEVEKKNFSKYTLMMGLSMDVASIDSMSYLSKYFEVIPPKQFYTACCDLTPTGKKYCKWIKSNDIKFNNELLELLSKHFEIGMDEIKDYCKILIKNDSGISYLHEICKKYGKSDKEIEKLIKL